MTTHNKRKQKEVITPDLFDTFATKNKDGSITFKVIRAGKPEGDCRRGGIWYEQQIYEGQKSKYSPESLRPMPVGVGGKTVIHTEITLNQPFVWNWTGKGNEAQAVTKLAKELIPEVDYKKLSKGITGRNAEKAFAAIESTMANILSKKGYDGVIFADSHLEGTVLPKQIFKFTKCNNRVTKK